MQTYISRDKMLVKQEKKVRRDECSEREKYTNTYCGKIFQVNLKFWHPGTTTKLSCVPSRLQGGVSI